VLAFRKSAPDHPAAYADLLRAFSLLIEALAIHSPNLDALAYASFRDAIRSLRNQIEKHPDQAFPLTGRIVQLFEMYSRGLEKETQQDAAQMREAVSTAMETAIALADPCCPALGRCALAEKALERKPHGEELREFNSRLKESLSNLSAESAERRKTFAELSQASAHPQSSAQAQLQAGLGNLEEMDPITGLPGMAGAELAIAGVLAAPAGSYLGIFTVERLNAVNARYGFGTGDRLMLEFAQELAQHFSGSDRLFRWRGPTMMALVKRTGRVLDVRTEMGRLASAKRDTALNLQGREVYMSIAVRSTVISLAEGRPFASILETLNTISSY
jgi:GGDEF domain-containing protein